MYDPNAAPVPDGMAAITSMPGGPITSHPPGSPSMAPGLGGGGGNAHNKPYRPGGGGGMSAPSVPSVPGVPSSLPGGPYGRPEQPGLPTGGPGGGFGGMSGGGMDMINQFKDALFGWLESRPSRQGFEGDHNAWRAAHQEWRGGMPDFQSYWNGTATAPAPAPAPAPGVAVGEPNPATPAPMPPQAAPGMPVSPLLPPQAQQFTPLLANLFGGG